MNTEAADIEAIERVVTTVERTQRAKDVEGFLALFHPAAMWTTAHGKVLIGLEAIAEFTRSVLPNASWDGVCVPKTPSIQVKRHAGTRAGCRRVDHVYGCRGGRIGPVR
jgi:uncharacterized protein (TIGR02246 family)